jgi:Flp pilus assembly protein TadD
VSPDELQALVEEATFDYVGGDSAAALAKLGRATAQYPDSFEAWHALAEVSFGLRRLDEALAAADRAHALNQADPMVNATLSRIWMERGDKPRAEHYGAAARMQSWKEELKTPESDNASNLH